MELNPTIIALAIAIIGFIAWLVRLESKATSTASKVSEMDTDLYSHRDDRTLHHDGEELNRRFAALESGLEKIDQAIHTGFSKINDRIDRLMNK